MKNNINLKGQYIRKIKPLIIINITTQGWTTISAFSQKKFSRFLYSPKPIKIVHSFCPMKKQTFLLKLHTKVNLCQIIWEICDCLMICRQFLGAQTGHKSRRMSQSLIIVSVLACLFTVGYGSSAKDVSFQTTNSRQKLIPHRKYHV